MTDSIKPSLDDARARIGRAEQHIGALQAEISSVLPAERTITAGMAGGFFGGGKHTLRAPPLISILIGETLYNLRSALDYLVYQLAILDTGKIQCGTKFLIEDTKKGWDDHLPQPGMPPKKLKKLWLPKLSGPHQTALKGLQPCFGCNWTKRLRELSNPDKHRELVTVLGNADHGPSFYAGPGPVTVTFKITTEVAFADGSLVVETLKLLQKEVSNVIEAFNPDFQ